MSRGTANQQKHKGKVKMNILIKTGLSAVLLAAFALPAYARKGPKGKCPEANLSEEQRSSVQEIWQEFMASIEGKSREERRELRAEFHQEVLDTVPSSDEQRAVLAECQQKRRRGKQRRCPEANLSEEQRFSAQEIWQEFMASIEGKSREERRELRAEFHQEVLDNVPSSDEQRAALAECQQKRRRGKQHRCPEANLSEEQQSAVQEIWREFRASAEGKSREERRELRAEFRQEILDTVPSSDEQRVALAECQQRGEKTPPLRTTRPREKEKRGLKGERPLHRQKLS